MSNLMKRQLIHRVGQKKYDSVRAATKRELGRSWFTKKHSDNARASKEAQLSRANPLFVAIAKMEGWL